MEPAPQCISCKVSLTNNTGNVTFPCPGCGKYQITRCRHCREVVAKYACPECGFEGPN